MKIIQDRPPNYDAIVARLPVVASRPLVIFCYGDAIYAPGSSSISEAIICHEKIHSVRQDKDPAGWWEKYLDDTEFRLVEELLAHRAEYRYDAIRLTRNQRRQHLRFIAQKLASPIYGFKFNFERAKQLLAKED